MPFLAAQLYAHFDSILEQNVGIFQTFWVNYYDQDLAAHWYCELLTQQVLQLKYVVFIAFELLVRYVYHVGAFKTKK